MNVAAMDIIPDLIEILIQHTAHEDNHSDHRRYNDVVVALCGKSYETKYIKPSTHLSIEEREQILTSINNDNSIDFAIRDFLEKKYGKNADIRFIDSLVESIRKDIRKYRKDFPFTSPYKKNIRDFLEVEDETYQTNLTRLKSLLYEMGLPNSWENS